MSLLLHELCEGKYHDSIHFTISVKVNATDQGTYAYEERLPPRTLGSHVSR